MVDETSEQKRFKDRVALPLLIKHAAPLIDGVLALPMCGSRHQAVNLLDAARGLSMLSSQLPAGQTRRLPPSPAEK